MTEMIQSSELIERAKALAPALARAGAASEKLGQPTDDIMKALEDAEFFKLMVPRCYGGLEGDMDTFVDVVLALAEGDASLAWVCSFLIEHNWMFCLFPESFQKRLYADRSYVLAPAVVAPSGSAEAAPGGFELSGRWQFATGVSHADWVIIGALLPQGQEGPAPRFFALEKTQVKVVETWDMDGMRGTASHDLLVEKVFVPQDQSVSLVDMSLGCAPGSELHGSPLYKTPMVPLLTTAAALPALGRARAVVREYQEKLPTRRRMGMGPTLAERSSAQMRLARLSIGMHQSELLLRDTVRELCAKRNSTRPDEISRMQAQLGTVVRQSAETVGEIAATSGASVHGSSNALGRARRDLEVIRCHIAFDLDATLEATGKAMLEGGGSSFGSS